LGDNSTTNSNTPVQTVGSGGVGLFNAASISIAAIAGLTPPVAGSIPATTITATAQFTGTVAWSPSVATTFGYATSYTATITLTPVAGYTLTGVAADFFTVSGASSVSNPANIGVITAVFPATALPPPPPPATPPHIDGIAYMTLTAGYADTSTVAYTISGTPTVTVTKISGNAAIEWNRVTKKLEIAAGLPVGEYEVKLRATNAVSSVHTFIFSLTVEPKVYYLDIPTSFVGGTVQVVTKTPYLAEAGETVTLTPTPDEGYELESVYVYDYNGNLIPLSGTGLTRTFTMPANHIRIVVVFRDTRSTGNDVLGAHAGAPLQAWTANGVLYISGLTSGETWHVYNITGTLIYQGIADDVETRFIASPLPHRGVYIIRSGGKTVKVVN
jgi:hypothetical protein